MILLASISLIVLPQSILIVPLTSTLIGAMFNELEKLEGDGDLNVTLSEGVPVL